MADTENPDNLKEDGLAAFRRGDYEQALTLFETAVTAYAAVNNPAGQGEMLNNMGVIYRLRRQPDKALAVLKQAEGLFAALADANRQGYCWGNMGDVYAAMRRRQEAARAYSQAAALFAQANEPGGQAMVLRALSLLKLRQGQWLAAMVYMRDSLQVRPSPTIAQRLFAGLLRFALRLMGQVS